MRLVTVLSCYVQSYIILCIVGVGIGCLVRDVGRKTLRSLSINADDVILLYIEGNNIRGGRKWILEYLLESIPIS